ncbi:hypothetical protein FMEAI12_2130004 [Parafrankia sp. Ea1.12]|nr:hypothetical protein FMEAI12_2130004 [Parafrankia sp. Ea1.12]
MEARPERPRDHLRGPPDPDHHQLTHHWHTPPASTPTRRIATQRVPARRAGTRKHPDRYAAATIEQRSSSENHPDTVGMT